MGHCYLWRRMNIVVNTRFLMKDHLEGIGYFTKEVFERIANAHPEHKFYFLFDRPYADDLHLPNNVSPVVIGPPARHPLLWKYWFDVKVPAVLRKVKADLFVSTDGFCSLATRVPQLLLVHDLGFLHYPTAYKKSNMLFYKTYTPRFLKKAKAIATVSEYTKLDLVNQYAVEPGKIGVVYSAVKPSFRPLAEEEKNRVKDQYTGGNEFFIYAGAIQPRKNLVNLLKAFSLYKKRLKNNWKLVLTGRLAWKNQEFMDLMKTYKYRNDVVMTGYVDEEELVNLVGASYALVYPSYFEGFGVPVLEAMKAEVPALTSGKSSMEEIAGEAALYFDPHKPEDIAEKMMLIYKDEDLRRSLISKGKTVVIQYSWDRTAQLVWQQMIKALD